MYIFIYRRGFAKFTEMIKKDKFILVQNIWKYKGLQSKMCIMKKLYMDLKFFCKVNLSLHSIFHELYEVPSCIVYLEQTSNFKWVYR